MIGQLTHEVEVLRAKVAAFRDEVEIVIAFHEAWRPMVHDTALHERMGRSRATLTFNDLRLALRREVILGLMRLWDSDPDAVNLENIGRSLRNKRKIGALVKDCENKWASAPTIQNTSSLPTIINSDDDDEGLQEAIRFFSGETVRTALAPALEKTLQGYIDDALKIIDRYSVNGTGYDSRMHLKNLRDQILAHRQVKLEVAVRDKVDVEIEQFYQDMLDLVVLLAHAVQFVSYKPHCTAKIRRRNAELFWNGVRGEHTVGHPDYGSSPPSNTD